MVKNPHLNDGFSEFLWLEVSSVKGQSLVQKEKKRKEEHKKKFKSEKLEDLGHFIIQKPKQKCCEWY